LLSVFYIIESVIDLVIFPDRLQLLCYSLLQKEVGMSKRSLRIIPGTALGKWSVILIITMPLLFVIGSSFTNTLYESIPAGNTILADIAARPLLALTMLVGMAAGVVAFILGLTSIIKNKERALLVYFSTLIGGLLILYLIGEVVFPH
jgi:hypothetical protein